MSKRNRPKQPPASQEEARLQREFQERLAREDMRREVHQFIDSIVATATEPANWPLEDADRIAFVRRTVFQARKISQTPAYQSEAISLSIQDPKLQS